MRFIDLFAGIGGFRIGFEKAGYECVFTSEINTFCQEVYYNNFGDKPHGDITKISPKQIPEFEVLIAGFPCQPFSISGRKKGFGDTRGTLFFEICKIIDAHHPTVVVLENVKHLIHHDRGKTLQVILNSLEELGYQISYKILNAKDFGVPQHRERIFIIASKHGAFNFNLLKTKPTPKLRDFLSINGNYEILEKIEYTLIESPRTQPESGLIFVGYRNKNTWKVGVRPNTEHLSRVHRQPNRIYSVEGVHPTLPSQETSGRFFIFIPETNTVRKLTIEECYKIMGFPKKFKMHSSMSESYKQIGNAVCVPVIKALAMAIKKQGLLNKNSEGKEYEPQRKTFAGIQQSLFV